MLAKERKLMAWFGVVAVVIFVLCVALMPPMIGIVLFCSMCSFGLAFTFSIIHILEKRFGQAMFYCLLVMPSFYMNAGRLFDWASSYPGPQPDLLHSAAYFAAPDWIGYVVGGALVAFVGAAALLYIARNVQAKQLVAQIRLSDF